MQQQPVFNEVKIKGGLRELEDVMRVFLLVFIALISILSPIYSGEGNEGVGIAFMAADITSDGFVDEGEFDVYYMRLFDTLDVDYTNSLDREECAVEDYYNDDEEMAEIPEYMHCPFMMLDIDHNERVSPGEFLIYGRSQFKLYDVNRNDMMEKSEFSAFYYGLQDWPIMINEVKNSK